MIGMYWAQYYPVVDSYRIDLMEVIILSSRVSTTNERLKLKMIVYKNVYLYVIFDFIIYIFFITMTNYLYFFIHLLKSSKFVYLNKHIS